MSNGMITQKDLDEMQLFVRYKDSMIPLTKYRVDVTRDDGRPLSFSLDCIDSWTANFEGYCNLDLLNRCAMGNFLEFSKFYPSHYPPIKKVIFNDPATIVFWRDETKTVVKCQKDDKYDKMTGLAMAISKKAFGNKGRYYDIFKKWCEED